MYYTFINKLPYAIKWRYLHWFVFKCTHPKGCYRCNWCGFRIEQLISKERLLYALERLGVNVAGTFADPLRWSKTDLVTDLLPILEEQMTINLETAKKMSLFEAEAELKNRVYEATALLETLENAGNLRGNGHHARQEVSDLAERILKQRWIN